MCGPNRFIAVNHIRPVDSKTAALGLGIVFEKSQPGRVAISLNSFLTLWGSGKTHQKDRNYSPGTGPYGCVNLDKVLEL